MDADQTPAERVRELATLAATIQSCRSSESSLSNNRAPDDWEPDTPEESAYKQAEYTRLWNKRREAETAFDALLAETRVETPAEIAAWTEALLAVPDDIVAGLAEKMLDRPGITGTIFLPALENALSGQWSNRRAEAWKIIVKVLGLEPHLQGPDGRPDDSTEVELWEDFLWHDHPIFVKMASEGMRQIIRQLQAGATPESLGIVWMPDPDTSLSLWLIFPASYYQSDAVFPVEKIAQLTGTRRRWAESRLAFRLEDKDLRTPPALARLGAKWLVPVLEAFAHDAESPPELREQIAESLRVLNDGEPLKG